MMKMTYLQGYACVAALLLGGSSGFAQQPSISNAQIATRSASGGLEKEFQSLVRSEQGRAWIGYTVPMIEGRRGGCGSDECCATRLEERGRPAASANPAPPTPVLLEGERELVVLFRIEGQGVHRIRTFSADCRLDAGGLTVYWLTGVRPAESVALLASQVGAAPTENDDRQRIANAAIAAIAFHAGASADTALDRFTERGEPEAIRKKAAFWMGSSRGHHGFEVLDRLSREDKSERFRKELVFALSVSEDPAAIQSMIRMARHDDSPQVRGQALFWLAHKAGEQAAAAITEAIANDPETEVKKRAVFALSQLPKDEGIPKLISLARTNNNAAVRKQALFWLGQSGDPRALAFLEEILTR